MTHDPCYVYLLHDAFDVGDTHTLHFICKYHFELGLLTQTVDLLRMHPPKGRLKTFDYQGMPPSLMHTSAARNVVLFGRI